MTIKISYNKLRRLTKEKNIEFLVTGSSVSAFTNYSTAKFFKDLKNNNQPILMCSKHTRQQLELN